MGRKTLQNFRQDLVDALQRGTINIVGEGRLDGWIHDAMYEFGYAFKFRELEKYEEQLLEVGQSAVTFPVDFRFGHENGLVLLGQAGYEGRLLPETRTEFLRNNRTVLGYVEDNRPRRYHIYGTQFIIRPAADKEYTLGLHYWATIPDLVDEIEPSIFGSDWDEAIFTGALYRGFRHFNEFDRYQNVKNDFISIVRSRKMAEDLEEFPEGGISVVNYLDQEQDEFYGRHGYGHYPGELR